MFLDQVITFAKEYLFPWFKFLNKEWKQFEPTKDKSCLSFVKQHLPIGPDKDFANEWDQIIAPTIVNWYEVQS